MKTSPDRLGTFTLDADELCTTDGGTKLTCGGGVDSGTLKTLFAKAVASPSTKSDHSHPYEHAGSNPPHGPVNVTVGPGGSWSLTGIPLNGLTRFDLYVWGLFDTPDFVHPTGGGGQTYTLGSGTGSVGSCGRGGFVQGAYSRQRAAAVEAMPRVYRLTLDIASLNLAAHGAGFLGEGLLQSASLYLTYDERVSTLLRPVWTARNLADATGIWTLRAACDGSRQEAIVYFQQVEQRKVSKPLVWKTSKWSFHSRNTLITVGRTARGLQSPRLRVEPA